MSIQRKWQSCRYSQGAASFRGEKKIKTGESAFFLVGRF